MIIQWKWVVQLCPTLWDPMDCRLPGSSVHGIFQAIVLEWIEISFSRGSSQPRDWTWVSYISCIAGGFFTKNYILSIQSAKTRPGADCGSDHELLIAKFRLKLKKVGKTTRPFRYDLNQIPYPDFGPRQSSFVSLCRALVTNLDSCVYLPACAFRVTGEKNQSFAN